jgi:hypothetical protein
MNQKDLYTFHCPKLEGLVYIKEVFKPGEEKLTPNILNLDCSGRLRCGITPRIYIGVWGATNWNECGCPRIGIKDKERPLSATDAQQFVGPERGERVSQLD